MISVTIRNNMDSETFEADDNVTLRDLIESTRFRTTPGSRAMYNGNMLGDEDFGRTLRQVSQQYPSIAGALPVISIIAALKNG